MPKTKNALAELSAYLAMYRDFHRDDDRVNDHILTKAQRIVSELAKVEDIKEFGTVHVREAIAIDAVENCRAIAEEGYAR